MNRLRDFDRDANDQRSAARVVRIDQDVDVLRGEGAFDCNLFVGAPNADHAKRAVNRSADHAPTQSKLYPKLVLDVARRPTIGRDPKSLYRGVFHAAQTTTLAALLIFSGCFLAPHDSALRSPGPRPLSVAEHASRAISPPTSIIATAAGGSRGDSFPATIADLEKPDQLAVCPDGSILIAESQRNRIRRIDPDGTMRAIAGLGGAGFSGDGGQATAARLNHPTGVACDGAGNVFVADSTNHRIRRIDAATGIIETVAGSGTKGPGGQVGGDGPALSAQFYFPRSLAIDADGALLIADPFNSRIRRFDGVNVSTLITATGGFPTSVWPDGDGYLVAETGKHQVTRWQGGARTVIAGTGTAGVSPDGAAAASPKISGPVSVSRIGADVVFAEQNAHRVRAVRGGLLATIAGTAGQAGFSGDNGPGPAAKLNRPGAVTALGSGALVSDTDNGRVRLVTGVIETVAGVDPAATNDGHPAAAARFVSPTDIAEGPQGTFIADQGAGRIRLIAPDGIISTVALADLPFAIAVDSTGALFYVETGQRRLRKLSVDGASTVADGFKYPLGLGLDASDRPYVADAAARRVYRIEGGVKVPFAGTGTATTQDQSNLGDGGDALAATFITPRAVIVAPDGSVLISDDTAHRVRRIDAAGIITTIAGNGVRTGSIDGPSSGDPLDDLGDGNAATSATLNAPAGLAFDGATLLIADATNHRLRAVSAAGIISTRAGTRWATGSIDDEGGSSLDDLGDGGDPTLATFNAPVGLAVAGGRILIADSEAARLRIIARASVPPEPTSSPTPSPTNTVTPSRTPTVTVTRTATASVTPTRTATVTSTETATSSPTRTATPLLNTPTLPPTQTPTATATQRIPTETGIPATATRVLLDTATPTLEPTLKTPSSTPTWPSISGRVATSSGRPVTDVQLTFMGGSMGAAETGELGEYAMRLEPGDWTVTPMKSGGWNGAVSSLDAAWALQAAVQLRTLTPEQRTAADVTGNGDVTSLDASRILSFVVEAIPRLPIAEARGSDWAFEPTSGDVTLPPDGVRDFTATLYGDITNNWRPESATGAVADARLAVAARRAQPAALSVSRHRIMRGPASEAVKLGRAHPVTGGVRVPILLAVEASAVDLTLTFPPTATVRKVVPVEGVTLASKASPGRVAIAAASAKPVPARRAIAWVELETTERAVEVRVESARAGE